LIKVDVGNRAADAPLGRNGAQYTSFIPAVCVEFRLRRVDPSLRSRDAFPAWRRWAAKAI
jgi:hypothetical protein